MFYCSLTLTQYYKPTMPYSNRRAVITEELLSITDGIKEAIVLRQMLYWVVRHADIDEFIREERERIKKGGGDPEIELTGGWIYKSGDELADETMIGSGKTARRRLNSLVEKGYLRRRKNPHHEWDQTWQYRPNIDAIESDLRDNEYTLATVMGSDFPVIERLLESVDSLYASIGQDDDSSGQSGDAIPETTTEKNTQSARAREEDLPPHAPTEKEVVEYGTSRAGLSEEECRKFWRHYSAVGWLDPQGRKISNWKLKLGNWDASRHRYNTSARNDSSRRPSGDGEVTRKTPELVQ